MSGFDDWLIDYQDNDDWCDRDITEDMEFAYNAGMERAAEIAVQSNPDSRSVVITEVCREIASNIRKEVEK